MARLLRCQAGDIAIITRDRYGDIGRLVHVTRAALALELELLPPNKRNAGHLWFIRPLSLRDLHTEWGAVPCAFIYDHWLAPLPRAGIAAVMRQHEERRSGRRV